MFSESASWYDLLYSFKDYQQESDGIIKLLKRTHPTAKTVLDIACGTAEHDRYLAHVYEVDGLDLSQDFLTIAKEKNPTGRYFCADMIAFDLARTYDIVLCLFSSIGYVKTIDNVVSTLKCFKEHLSPGGIVVVEPWFVPEAWNPNGRVHMLTGESETCKVCRMNVSEQDGTCSVINFHYLVGTSDGVHHFIERHELGLFSVDEMKDAFQKAGLSVQYDSEGLTGRGLYVARQVPLECLTGG